MATIGLFEIIDLFRGLLIVFFINELLDRGELLPGGPFTCFVPNRGDLLLCFERSEG